MVDLASCSTRELCLVNVFRTVDDVEVIGVSFDTNGTAYDSRVPLS